MSHSVSSKMWKTFGLICVLALTAPTECREKVNFDFAWRFKLNPHTTPPPSPSPSPHPPLPPPSPNPPPNRLATCKNCKHGTNYGTGSISIIHTGTYDDCCTACAAQPECKAWDWNENGGKRLFPFLFSFLFLSFSSFFFFFFFFSPFSFSLEASPRRRRAVGGRSLKSRFL